MLTSHFDHVLIREATLGVVYPVAMPSQRLDKVYSEVSSEEIPSCPRVECQIEPDKRVPFPLRNSVIRQQVVLVAEFALLRPTTGVKTRLRLIGRLSNLRCTKTQKEFESRGEPVRSSTKQVT